MTDVVLTGVVLWLGVTAYAVFGGADFGAGFWDLTAGAGDRADRARSLISAAIGPVWEANHTWLIFDLVILWTAFPPAFAAIMSTLFVPLSLAAVGIVLRGAAFAFRPVAADSSGGRLAGTVFAASSVVTPFFLGTVAGAIASGRVSTAAAPADLFGSWLNPTSVLVGCLAIAVCAYLAAVFLVNDARRLGFADLESYFLRRATVAAVVAGGIAAGGIAVVVVDAPIVASDLRPDRLAVHRRVRAVRSRRPRRAPPGRAPRHARDGGRRRGRDRVGLGRRAVSGHPARDDVADRRGRAHRFPGRAAGRVHRSGAGHRPIAGAAVHPGPAQSTRQPRPGRDPMSPTTGT